MPASELIARDVKIHILEDGEYAYNIDRQVYFNRKTKKVFSVEFIEDNSPSVLEKCVMEPTEGMEWRFYFNSPPSESVRRQVEVSLG
jgi:hypothetical protein